MMFLQAECGAGEFIGHAELRLKRGAHGAAPGSRLPAREPHPGTGIHESRLFCGAVRQGIAPSASKSRSQDGAHSGGPNSQQRYEFFDAASFFFTNA